MMVNQSPRSQCATPRGKCVTFYSYKGGVGRTLAVAGVAIELAQKHLKRVLVIDWDLDAPSLHIALNTPEEELRHKRGLLDYIADSRKEFKYLQQHQMTEGLSAAIDLQEYIFEVDRGRVGLDARGVLHLISAGKFGVEYLYRLQELDWNNLYARQGGFWIIERLRLQISQMYDYVLIDARAGRSEVSLVPLLQLSDIACLVFAQNETAVSGLASIAPALAAHSRVDQAPLAVMLLPSLIRHPSLSAFCDQAADSVAKCFTQHGVQMLDEKREGFRLYLPFDEQVAVSGKPDWNRKDGIGSGLREIYAEIADLIATNLD